MQNNFEFETRKRYTPSINLTALMDIAFILVIFIVLAANFHRIENLEINLPQASGSQMKQKDALKVMLFKNGFVFINDQKVSWPKVRSVLKQYLARFNRVVLITDQETPIQKAVKVLSDAQQLGFKSVNIAVKGVGK